YKAPDFVSAGNAAGGLMDRVGSSIHMLVDGAVMMTGGKTTKRKGGKSANVAYSALQVHDDDDPVLQLDDEPAGGTTGITAHHRSNSDVGVGVGVDTHDYGVHIGTTDL